MFSTHQEYVMKRLMFLVLIAIFTLGSGAAVAEREHKAGSTYCRQNPEKCSDSGSIRPADLQPASAMSDGGLIVGATGPTAPFLPRDTIYASNLDNVGRRCDLAGNYTDSARFRCKEMLSRSSGLRYRVRQSTSEGYRVFIVTQNGTLQRYADCDASNKVVYQSDAAEKVAQANGYRLDTGNNTMVATNAAPAAAPPPCDEHVTLQNMNRNLCKDQHGDSTSTAATTPAPTQDPQGPDCSKLSGLVKFKCNSATALAKTKGVLPDIPVAVIVK